MQQWWNDIDSGKPKVLEERAQEHHKSQTERFGIWQQATVVRCRQITTSDTARPAFSSGAFAELRKTTINYVMPSVCPSSHPQGTTRLPLDGFS